MQHKLVDDVNVNINAKFNVPNKELEELLAGVGICAAVVIGFYMGADTARHIVKTLIK